MSEPTTTMRDALEAAFEEAGKAAPAADQAPSTPEPIEPTAADLEASANDTGAAADQPAGQDLNALAEGQAKDGQPQIGRAHV